MFEILFVIIVLLIAPFMAIVEFGGFLVAKKPTQEQLDKNSELIYKILTERMKPKTSLDRNDEK